MYLTAGLGLAVVARIVEQLGGQLRVDSRVDEGSRFSFLVAFSADQEDTRSIATTSRPHDEITHLVNALASTSLQTSPRTHVPALEVDSKGKGIPGRPKTPALRKQPSPKITPPQVDSALPVKLRILIVEVRDVYAP